MTALHTSGAAVRGPIAPMSENAGRQAEVTAIQGEAESTDCLCNCLATPAALTIEGEAYALAYLERLQHGRVVLDDLTVLIAFLQGEMLAGACRVIEKALRRGHHA